MTIQAPTGTQDIFPPDTALWQWMEARAREVFRCYGYGEIRTPIFEDTRLFIRSVGEGTDIVEKQMYVIPAGEEDSITLRPEATASVVRAYLSHHLHKSQPFQKLYYLGPMFRHERPQKGRQRQFHQIGVEILGSSSFVADVEAMDLMHALYRAVGIQDVRMKLNSLGCAQCRPAYQDALKEAVKKELQDLCEHCQVRYEKNILRIFDCKVKQCRAISASFPKVSDHLCSGCQDYHEKVTSTLSQLNVPWEQDPRLVRGLDYYTRTVWEAVGQGLGSQDAVGAGGRYDGLVAQLGGPEIPGVGFAIGMERLLLCMKERPDCDQVLDLYLVQIDAETTLNVALDLVKTVRQAALAADLDLEGRSLKAQMRNANRRQARFVAVLGPDELATGEVTLKDMSTSEQKRVKFQDLIAHISKQTIQKGGE